MEYEIVKYCSEFKRQVVELQTHLWNPDLFVNTAHLEWKYERNPYLGQPLIYLVLWKGKVVGMRGVYGAQWQVGCPPRSLPALCASDLVIAPEHRNRGLFTKIMRAALDDLADLGYAYVFNLGAGPVTYLGSLTMGWHSVGQLQTMCWQNTSHPALRYVHKLPFLSAPSPRMRRYANRLGVSFLFSTEQYPFFYFFDRSAAGRCREISPYIRVEQMPRPAAMAELVERIGNDGRIRHVRDQQYFAWRFNNPLSAYRFLFWEDARLEGYLVLQKKLYMDKIKVNMVDWEATNWRVRADLLQAAIHLGHFSAIMIWSPTLSEETKGLLQNAGFAYVDKVRSIPQYRPTVLVRSVRDQIPKTEWAFANRQLLDLANWDLRMIYSDNY